MSVVAEISVSATEFALGRIVDVSGSETVELESVVPAGERAVPFLWVSDADFDAFEERVTDDSAVDDVAEIDAYADRALYTFEWSVESDVIFRAIRGVDAYILGASGSDGSWRFELRFPSHDALSAFRKQCRSDGVCFEVLRVYSPSEPDLGSSLGLTVPQREAVVLAVEAGYYDIPRRCTTIELGERLGISDQAVTERLRRATVALVSNTLLTTPTD